MHINPMLQRNKENKKKLDALYILSSPIDTTNKLIIDIDDIIRFCFCPRQYYYYKQKDVNLKDLYDISLHNTIYSYLIALQNNRLDNTLEFLKYKWGENWIKYKNNTTKDILITFSASKRDWFETKRKKGIDAIFTFNDMMIKDRQFPIIIGHKYQIEILPNIILTGNLEYVRELSLKNDKVIQVVRFISETNRFTTNMSKKYDLKLMAMSYAFKELFDTKNFQSVSIDMDTKKVLIQNYSEKDYNLLKRTVRDTIICIQNDIKCISPDKKCFHCEYRDICISNINKEDMIC